VWWRRHCSECMFVFVNLFFFRIWFSHLIKNCEKIFVALCFAFIMSHYCTNAKNRLFLNKKRLFIITLWIVSYKSLKISGGSSRCLCWIEPYVKLTRTQFTGLLSGLINLSLNFIVLLILKEFWDVTEDQTCSFVGCCVSDGDHHQWSSSDMNNNMLSVF